MTSLKTVTAADILKSSVFCSSDSSNDESDALCNLAVATGVAYHETKLCCPKKTFGT